MAKQTREKGKAGLNSAYGIVFEEFMRELRGARGYKLYNEMRLNSPIIGALLLANEMAVRGVNFFFTSNLGEDDPRIEFLDQAREAMTQSWNDFIVEVLTMLPFGWSYFETVYHRIAGHLLWRKFAIRGQDTLHRWELDEAGGIQGMWQATQPTFKPILIPIKKSLLFRTRVERNNPEGRSILRNAYTSYYYWKNISQIEAIGIERGLAGMLVLKLPEAADTSANSTDMKKAQKIVRNVRRDEQDGLVIPYGWEAELMSTGGSRQFDTSEIVKRYESRMLMSALAQFLILGQDNVGTQALSSDMTDFFNMAVNASVDIITETFTKHAIPRLLRLNGLPDDGMMMEHTPAGDADLVETGEFLEKVTGLLTWTPQDEIWIRAIANLPTMSVEEIEAAREEKRQQEEEARAQLPQFQPQADQQMDADWFVSDRTPDDDARRTWERRYKSKMRRFFAEQKERVLKAVKVIR